MVNIMEPTKNITAERKQPTTGIHGELFHFFKISKFEFTFISKNLNYTFFLIWKKNKTRTKILIKLRRQNSSKSIRVPAIHELRFSIFIANRVKNLKNKFL